MKISASTDGGFAGLAESYELDTAELAVGPALEALLQRLDFFGAAPAAPAAVGAELPDPRPHARAARPCGSMRHLLMSIVYISEFVRKPELP
ncbi:hypothetical protein RCH14_000566 [Massilia sp. MP_M2]|uniref:hypothetical protein n=1 Tax=Massilia sp. MP_M2 TaxID=3071713 RepID=UPI00319DF3FE